MNTLKISTSNAKTDLNNRLKYVLNSPLSPSSYVALSNINLWYNWRNITQKMNNNTFTYKVPSDAGALHQVMLPDGSYTVEAINNFLHHIMENNGHFDSTKSRASDERYAINLYANATYNRITLKIASDVYEISFGAGMAKVLGANANTFYNKTENFPNVPQLENVVAVQVHCNLVYNVYQSDSSLLYSFSPNSSFGSPLSITPTHLQWMNTLNASERVVEVWLTNQDGKVLLLEDHWGVVLQITDKDLTRI